MLYAPGDMLDFIATDSKVEPFVEIFLEEIRERQARETFDV
jgi:hypothetical protein